MIRGKSPEYKSIKKSVNKALHDLHLCTNSPEGDRKARAVYDDLRGRLDKDADISSFFILRRDGFFCLSRITWLMAKLRTNSEEHAAERQINLEHNVADQFYYFVRDITHNHQHHSEDADTILTAYRADGRNLDWCQNVVYALFYHVIDVKRRKRGEEHINLLGVLAYIEAFKSILVGRAKDADRSPDDLLPHFNEQSTKNSIQATKTFLEAQASQHKQRSDTVRNWGIFTTGATVTALTFIVNLADESVKTEPNLLSFANLLKEHAWLVLAPPSLLVVFACGHFVLHTRTKFIRNFIRDALRLFIVNRLISAVVLSIAAIALLGLVLNRLHALSKLVQ